MLHIEPLRFHGDQYLLRPLFAHVPYPCQLSIALHLAEQVLHAVEASPTQDIVGRYRQLQELDGVLAFLFLLGAQLLKKFTIHPCLHKIIKTTADNRSGLELIINNQSLSKYM